MNKQGPFDIQTAIFEDYLEVENGFKKKKIRQNLVNFRILAKSFFFESKIFL